MIIRSGIANKYNSHDLVNIRHIAEVVVINRPTDVIPNRIPGELVVAVFYPDMENYTIVYAGNEKDCEIVVLDIWNAYGGGNNVHYIPEVATIDD